MSFKIGFTAETNTEITNPDITVAVNTIAEPRKSVVQVHFPARGLTCAYYNDAFDLHSGDIVYVDGKLEGLQGRVTDVSYTFKIKLSDYKRVIGKADTDICGELYMADSHFVAFDNSVIPFEKIITWFKAPENPEDEYVSGNGNEVFRLDNLSGMNVRPEIARRGEEYYIENKVAYICVDGTHGRAIIAGGKAYEAEFNYINGEIENLVCSCFCSNICKHEFAAMLQLRETLKYIEDNYSAQYESSGYFAAVGKSAFFSFAIDRQKTKSLILRKFSTHNSF